MKHELELRIQALLDGEVSEHEAAQLADWVERDAEAGVLAAELGTVRKAMVDNEMIVALPETREFHWSKIERQIQRETLAPNRPPVSWLARWRRALLPLAGVTALACVLTLAVVQMHRPTFDEISATDEGMEAVTFHDQSAELTVVWLQDSSQTSGAGQPAKTSIPEEAHSDFETE
jgi:hypothetical protein